MSRLATRFAVRAEIETLKGKGHNKAYKYFKERLGEPDEVHKTGEEITSFHYNYDEHELIPVSNLDCDRWGVEYRFDSGLYEVNMINIPGIEKVFKKVESAFSEVDKNDLYVVAYNWHTGTDEVVVFG